MDWAKYWAIIFTNSSGRSGFNTRVNPAKSKTVLLAVRINFLKLSQNVKIGLSAVSLRDQIRPNLVTLFFQRSRNETKHTEKEFNVGTRVTRSVCKKIAEKTLPSPFSVKRKTHLILVKSRPKN
jgi:hypothetical protein